MEKFEFRKKEIAMEIGGVVVSVPGTTDYLLKVQAAGASMAEYGNGGEKEAADTREFMLDVLEELLGAEALDAILAVQDMDTYDCMDVFQFLVEQVRKYHEEKAIGYGVMPGTAQNRQQRRAARAKQ